MTVSTGDGFRTERRLCPLCGRDDEVDLTKHGGAESFYCGRDNLAYTGSHDEWVRLAPRRELRIQQLARDESGLFNDGEKEEEEP